MLALVGSAPAHAATHFGSGLNATPEAAACTAPEGCTFVATTAPSPVSGVIVRVRYRSGSFDPVTLRLVRLAGEAGTAAGSVGGASFQGYGGIGEIPTRAPVEQGDYLAFDATSTSAYSCENRPTGSQVFEPRIPDGGTATVSREGCELLVNAEVEPDDDRDGFGDESQDNCSTFIWNPDQRDSDFDGLGDACDSTPFFEPVQPCGRRYTGDGRDYQAKSASARNPLLGETWFVDPEEPSVQDSSRFVERGQFDKAALMWRIGARPKFRWFGKFTRPNLAQKVREYLARVQCTQPGAVAQMAILRGQSKECREGYKGGGATEDAAHRAWLRTFAKAIGDSRVIIAYEPDSLGTIDCLDRGRRRARLRVLRLGVKLLSRLPNATVYLEAGASDWEGARVMARKLRSIGIRWVRGFMLNVTHSDWTAANIRYGTRLSKLVGGKHFVINTSINGRGPTRRVVNSGGRRVSRNIWCNAPDAGLGPPPTTVTGNRLVDAFLWIGRPGYSGGSCFGGPLPIGAWWREHALKLAARASERLGP